MAELGWELPGALQNRCSRLERVATRARFGILEGGSTRCASFAGWVPPAPRRSRRELADQVSRASPPMAYSDAIQQTSAWTGRARIGKHLASWWFVLCGRHGRDCYF